MLFLIFLFREEHFIKKTLRRFKKKKEKMLENREAYLSFGPDALHLPGRLFSDATTAPESHSNTGVGEAHKQQRYYVRQHHQRHRVSAAGARSNRQVETLCLYCYYY